MGTEVPVFPLVVWESGDKRHSSENAEQPQKEEVVEVTEM